MFSINWIGPNLLLTKRLKPALARSNSKLLLSKFILSLPSHAHSFALRRARARARTTRLFIDAPSLGLGSLSLYHLIASRILLTLAFIFIFSNNKEFFILFDFYFILLLLSYLDESLGSSSCFSLSLSLEYKARSDPQAWVSSLTRFKRNTSTIGRFQA